MKNIEVHTEAENGDIGNEFRLNLLTQEIKLAKMLAGNEFNAAIKEKHIKKLSTWLRNRAACSQAFGDKDCLRLWKGLFYSMWMSDKPLPQESLATKIASLLHSFDRYEASLQFFATFLKTMAMEWNGIDQWRIDKFLMLVRKVTREMLRILHERDWSEDLIAHLSTKLSQTVLSAGAPRGLFMHFTELFFEEVGKVSSGTIDSVAVTNLLKPFMYYVSSHSDFKLIQYVVKNVFNYLLFQSDAGREYKEKYDAWKSMGFPGNSVNDLESEPIEDGSASDDDDDEEDEDEEADDENEAAAIEPNGVLDPRAGRVDVLMPEIKFDPLEVVKLLEEMRYKKYTRVRNRKCIERIVSTYTKFAGGTFPLGIQRINVKRDELDLPDPEDKALELMEFEENMFGEQRQLKKLNKRKRKKILADPALYEEFQRKNSKKPRLSLNDSNIWNEEDMPAPDAESLPKKRKLKAIEKKRLSNGFVESDQSQAKVEKTQQEGNVSICHTNGNTKITSPVPRPESPKAIHASKQNVNESPNGSGMMKNKLKAKNDEWTKPLGNGEVEYFIPSKKGIANGLEKMVTKIETHTPAKHPKSPKAASTPVGRVALLKSSTPNALLSSAEKKVKINLKNNISQEATEYVRQLKSSPSVPFDSAKKPLKGVLKPNLMPSPIDPFYKKWIGFKYPKQD